MLGILIAVREIWIPYMDAKEEKYTHIVADPFDGTVMPITSVPDWNKPEYRNKALQFQDIPLSGLIALPRYNPQELLQPNIQPSTIIAKFTYTVPYMGSYLLNYKEYDGSHLGVDIRSVIGTPVLAIANGVVVQAVEGDATGNKYVVIRHDNVPFE